MESQDVDLVQSTFDKATVDGDAVAILFYERLFEIAPELQPLFRGDMAEQSRKFVATLAVMVGSLHSLAAIQPAVSALARRHVVLGVKPEHYTKVGEALLFALERRLGPWWTGPVAAAWRSAYAELSAFMIEEARGGAGAAR